VTMHLRVSAGGHELLLDSASVQRVMPAEDARPPTLPFLDLSLKLGGEGPARPDGAVILYGAGEAAILLAVDEVKGLVALEPEALVRLPRVSPSFGQLFDAIAVEPVDGRHPLHLRPRIDLQAIAREGTSDGH
jgi:hypothetical protein